MRNPVSIAMIGCIRAYQAVLSPVMGGGCRFRPSCSNYAIEAIKTHGAFKGFLLALMRILRCRPFGPSGYDPVPPKGKWRADASGTTPAVNRAVSERAFKYYIFDWDDNILKMPTKIHLERRLPDGSWVPAAISTSVFAVVRDKKDEYRPPADGGWDAAYRDFRDDGEGASTFLRETAAAIEKIKNGSEAPGPSFETLRRTLREGRIFAIVTARGHEPSTIKSAVRLFIDTVLTAAEREEMMANLRGYRAWLDKRETFGTDAEELDYYLSMCHFNAVTHPAYKRLVAESSGDPSSENAKKFAIRDFVEHVAHILERTGGIFLKPVSIGFSDDDAANVSAVGDFIAKELAKAFPEVKFVLYDTGDPSLTNGRKIVVSNSARAALR